MGIIDVSVVYSDGTEMGLEHLSPSDYWIEVMTQDHKVVGVALTDGPQYPPQVVAKGRGLTYYTSVFKKSLTL